MNDEFNLIFFKTPYYINSNGFQKSGSNSFYNTFEQNGKFILFIDDNKLDYITEVVKY